MNIFLLIYIVSVILCLVGCFFDFKERGQITYGELFAVIICGFTPLLNSLISVSFIATELESCANKTLWERKK